LLTLSIGDLCRARAAQTATRLTRFLTNCRALGMVRMEQKGPTGRISNPRVIVTPTWISRPEEMSQGLSQQYKAEIEQFFATAGFFAAAEPKILGWSSAEEAEVHIRENSIELGSQD
jgi:inorganic pyrophosphatase